MENDDSTEVAVTERKKRSYGVPVVREDKEGNFMVVEGAPEAFDTPADVEKWIKDNGEDGVMYANLRVTGRLLVEKVQKPVTRVTAVA